MIGPQQLDDVLNGAQKAGALQASAVWALFVFYLVAERFFERRAVSKASEKSMEIRNKSAEASIKNAEALQEISDKNIQMLLVLSEAATILRELNRRIKCLGG